MLEPPRAYTLLLDRVDPIRDGPLHAVLQALMPRQLAVDSQTTLHIYRAKLECQPRKGKQGVTNKHEETGVVVWTGITEKSHIGKARKNKRTKRKALGWGRWRRVCDTGVRLADSRNRMSVCIIDGRMSMMFCT